MAAWSFTAESQSSTTPPLCEGEKSFASGFIVYGEADFQGMNFISKIANRYGSIFV